MTHFWTVFPESHSWCCINLFIQNVTVFKTKKGSLRENLKLVTSPVLYTYLYRLFNQWRHITHKKRRHYFLCHHKVNADLSVLYCVVWYLQISVVYQRLHVHSSYQIKFSPSHMFQVP